LVAGLIFLGAGVGAWRRLVVATGMGNTRQEQREETRNPDARTGGQSRKYQRRFWLAILVALVLASMWELLGLEYWVGTHAREWARARDLYYPREVFQTALISLTLATLAACLALLKRVPGNRLLLGSLGFYLAIAGVNLLSLHQIDRIADLAWHGLSLVQVLKLVCTTLIFSGVQRAPDQSPGRER
jgi:hypothetical protein